jgi:hypothetical protein
MRLRFTFLTIILLVASSLSAEPATIDSIRGKVIDSSGSPLEGAEVTLTVGTTAPRTTVTSANGTFSFANVPPGRATVVATFGSLPPVAVEIEGDRMNVEIPIRALPISDQITVSATRPKTRITTATKTDTLLRDVPQSVCPAVGHRRDEGRHPPAGHAEHGRRRAVCTGCGNGVR